MKFKKLLAAAMAATMILSSMVTSFVASAAESAVVVDDVTVCPSDEATLTVNVAINLDSVTAPHAKLDVNLAGYTLTEVTSTDANVKEITVNDGIVIVETDVKDAVVFTTLPLTLKFTAEAGKNDAGTYDLTIDVLDATNVEEDDVVIAGDTATVTIAHAYKTVVTAPTCEADGYTTYTCACGDTYTGDVVPATGHNYVDGTCGTCGAADPDAPVGPAIDTNITIKPYIYYGSEIGVMFQLTKAQLDKYATYELVIDRQVYDTKYMLDDAETVVVPKAQVLNNTKKSPYYIIKGIGMYELGLNVSAYINCYNANGELIAKSDTWSDSVATVIKQAYTTASDLYKTLIADTLNMSAAAQKYFGQLPANVNSDLAKAPFVNADDPNYDFVASDYASKTTGELNAVENPITYNPNSPISTSSHYLMNSLIFGKSIGVTYLLRDSNSALDLSKLEIEVSYTSLYPAGTVTPTVERPLIVNRAGKWIQVSFEGVYLYDTNKVVTATIKYDGKEVLTTNYTVDTYCKAQLSSSDANTAALADATAKFGNSARAYFSNQTGYQV